LRHHESNSTLGRVQDGRNIGAVYVDWLDIRFHKLTERDDSLTDRDGVVIQKLISICDLENSCIRANLDNNRAMETSGSIATYGESTLHGELIAAL
jgi:hypothetical protein